MIIHTLKTTVQEINEHDEIIKEESTSSYIVYPSEGKLLREIKTKRIVKSGRVVSIRQAKLLYEEIDAK